MNYVDSLNLFGVEAKEIPCIKGSGAPAISTEGAVGLFYMNTNTGDVYKCDGVDDGVYTWNLLVDTVDIANKLGTDRFLRHPIDETDFSSNYGTPGSYAVSDGRGGVVWEEAGNNSDGNVDLTGYATEQYVQDYAQPKGNYLTKVPEDYAKKEDIPDAYTLPVGGEALGGVKNGGNVVINEDGTMTAPESSGGGSVTVDTEMSDTSENPVQNRVVKAYVDSVISGSWLEVY